MCSQILHSLNWTKTFCVLHSIAWCISCISQHFDFHLHFVRNFWSSRFFCLIFFTLSFFVQSSTKLLEIVEYQFVNVFSISFCFFHYSRIFRRSRKSVTLRTHRYCFKNCCLTKPTENRFDYWNMYWKWPRELRTSHRPFPTGVIDAAGEFCWKKIPTPTLIVIYHSMSKSCNIETKLVKTKH